MQKYSQKYTIVQFFETLPEGYEFQSSHWPLHVTLVDTFAIEWDNATITAVLTELLAKIQPVRTVAVSNTHFGASNQVEVVLIKRTAELFDMHNDLIKALASGGLMLNDPQYAEDGFRPHSTVQSESRLVKDTPVTFDALSIIDMYPDEDPFKRRVLKTLPIGNS